MPVSLDDVTRAFRQHLEIILDRVSSNPEGKFADVRTADATDPNAYRRLAPDAIMTSPPYGAAQKYPRATRIPLAILAGSQELSFRDLDAQTIGREDLTNTTVDLECELPEVLMDELSTIGRDNSKRGAIYAEYFKRMAIALSHQAKVLRPGGYYVLIASNNTVTGRTLPTHDYLALILEQKGLTPTLTLADGIPTRTLLTKRAKSAGQPISHEYIHILQKPENGRLR